MPMDVGQLRAYAAQLQKAPAKLRDDVETVLRASGQRLEAAAKQRAAVDTGFMRDTIGADEQFGGDSMSVTVGPIASYAPFVEYGHHAGKTLVPPQPFMGPALDSVEGGYIAALEAVAGKAFE